MVNVDGWSWYRAGLKEVSKDKTKIKVIRKAIKLVLLSGIQ